MLLPVDMFQVLSVAEVRDKYGGVVEALDDRVHVARVAQVLQTRQPSTLSK